ncbi:DUF2254 domain-containing protein [Blastopirellula marina]|uniref:DUF2254 domain-containing protein n=1 Tax=Blastopirellula marina TaxID=124 RepID=A0A2S8F4D4_9BACT|nr:DUF2254 domain-containing protein [Blastopirellula marina]PQO27000.1 hypothetical protein C5Y98_27465 [Blastopirellula marina]PTL41147.1 DUF2254 domain-containing protein [Blastopirellula marina]
MIVNEKWMNLWDRARASLWFVPILCTLGGILSAVVMLAFDYSWNDKWKLPFWLETTTDGAQTILSTISGGMITVVGVVLSMTMVTLSITSSQFGSRVLRSRIRDRTTQWTIGAFLGTAVYSLVVLKMVRKIGEEDFLIPHFSVMVAILFTITSLVILLYFIHHITMIAQAPEIVASLAHDLTRSIETIFPEKIGDPPPSDLPPSQKITDAQREALKNGVPIRSASEGYIQTIEGDELLALAVELDVMIELPKRPGDFLARQDKIALVAGNGKQDEKKLTEAINDAFYLGNSRSPRQDVNCSVHELAQMAVRALSPGINDPYTAVNCIDRLSAALCQLARRRMPDANRFDSQGNLRLVVDRQSFSSVMHAAFDQIRCYASSSTAVSQRLMEGYLRIAENVSDADQATDVLHQARLTLEGVTEAKHHPADVLILHEQYGRLKEQLEPLQSRPDPKQTDAAEDSVKEETREEGEASGEVIG